MERLWEKFLKHQKELKQGTYIQAGMCDEVSVVIAAAADGSLKTPALFDAFENGESDRPQRFELIDVLPQGGGAIWARYKIIKP